MKLICALFAALACLLYLNPAGAQDSTTHKIPVKLNVSGDLVSRYIWRGTDYGHSPAVQPTLSLSVGNFEVGGWGSVSMINLYTEIDLYAKYTVKWFTFQFTDYYIPYLGNGNDAAPDIRYFNYQNTTTAHTLEGLIQFKAGEKFPLYVFAGTYFYGNDKRWGYDAAKDTTGETYFSTYIEAGYPFSIHGYGLDVFIGGTPFAGAYGNAGGIVNLGVTGSRRIRITPTFDLPVRASLIFNPQASAAYFVFGITI
jgi:hypothetical protein